MSKFVPLIFCTSVIGSLFLHGSIFCKSSLWNKLDSQTSKDELLHCQKLVSIVFSGWNKLCPVHIRNWQSTRLTMCCNFCLYKSPISYLRMHCKLCEIDSRQIAKYPFSNASQMLVKASPG